MLKVVHVETGLHLYGGARQVAYLVEGLAERGVQNLLICPPRAAIVKALADRVRVMELPCSGDLDLGFLFRLAGLLRSEQPDLVHLHSRRGADWLGGLAAWRAGVPAVLSRRVDNPEPAWLVRRKYRLYARTICISQGIAEVLIGEGLDAKRIRVVRSALDPAPWRAAESRQRLGAEFQVPSEAPLIGVVAQLIERKGHRVLVEALAGLTDRPWQLLVFGQGPSRASLESAVAERGLAGRVHFAGFRDDLPRWLGALDLLVHPALMEGLGIALLQASAAGVPIIASRAGGIPEAVRDGVNGLLVPPGDPQALSTAIRHLLDHPAQRQALGQNGRSLIEREFSVDAMVEGNLAVYRELLSGAGEPG